MNKTQRILTDAAQIVRARHTTGQFARTIHGAPTDPLSKEAVAFCAEGAVIRAAEGRTSGYVAALLCLERALSPETLYVINDQHPEQLPVLFERAIAIAGQPIWRV